MTALAAGVQEKAVFHRANPGVSVNTERRKLPQSRQRESLRPRLSGLKWSQFSMDHSAGQGAQFVDHAALLSRADDAVHPPAWTTSKEVVSNIHCFRKISVESPDCALITTFTPVYQSFYCWGVYFGVQRQGTPLLDGGHVVDSYGPSQPGVSRFDGGTWFTTTGRHSREYPHLMAARACTARHGPSQSQISRSESDRAAATLDQRGSGAGPPVRRARRAFHHGFNPVSFSIQSASRARRAAGVLRTSSLDEVSLLSTHNQLNTHVRKQPVHEPRDQADASDRAGSRRTVGPKK